MNRSIDPTDAAGPTHDSIQLRLLDTLVQKIIEALADNSCKVKVGDALKAIHLREKVAKKCEAEHIFWQMLEEIKAEGPPGSHPEFTPLQLQIQAAIFPLRDCVKNAVLPVRAITEAFNNSRSEAARLTTRRIVKLLAGMGFTIVKASNGCTAILWDDELLPPAEHSDSQDFTSRPGLNALSHDGPECLSSHIEAEIHPASPPEEFSPGLVRSPGGEEMGLSSPLEGEEIKERGHLTREGFIQGLDVLPQNPPTPLPWDRVETAPSPTHPPIHPGSPPIRLSHQGVRASGGMNRMVHPPGRGGERGLSSPLAGEELKERGHSSRRKPTIEKNKNKAQNPLKALNQQFPASRDPPRR